MTKRETKCPKSAQKDHKETEDGAKHPQRDTKLQQRETK